MREEEENRQYHPNYVHEKVEKKVIDLQVLQNLESEIHSFVGTT